MTGLMVESRTPNGGSFNMPEESGMNISKRYSLLLSSSIVMVIFSGSIAAQDFGQLKDIMGGSGVSGAASSLGSLGSLPSITPGSVGNAAGIIDFCVKNNYLSASNASPVKDQLMGKLAGSQDQPAKDNPDYISGTNGILSGSNGQSVDLSMAGLKAEAGKEICQRILDQAKSMF